MPTTASLFNQGKTLAMDAMRDRQMSKKKYNGTVTHLEKKDDPVDGIVRVAAATVGFFSEASKYRKAKKQMKQGQNVEEVRPSEDTTAPINGHRNSHHQTRSATRTSVDYDYDTQRRQQPRRYEYTTADLNEAIWEQDEGNAMDRNARRPDHPPRYTTDPYDAHPSPGTDDRQNGTESYVVDTRGFAQNGLRRSSEEEVPPDDNPEKLGLWKRKKRERDLALHFLNRHPFDPATADPAPRNKLGLPVVIPQRRPEKRSRGFVRAYSPILADAGIDEPTFLDFVDTFNKAIEPNPYLYAINLAGTVGLIAPDPFTLLVGVAATAAAEASIAMRSRYKSAAFLDRVNAEFFMPRGLVCMVATWKPEATGDAAVGSTVDFDGRTVGADGRVGFDGRGATLDNPNYRLDNAGRLIDSQDRLIDENGRLLLDRDGNPLGHSPAKPSLAQRMNNMRPYLSSTTAMQKFTEQVKPSAAAFKWPEPAPLVFPSAQATAERERTKPNGKRKNALDRGEVWLDEFMDKRAQARYVQDNPTFTVASALPKPAFASRYADPNHPAASGDIVAFITGGKYSTKGKVDLAGKTGAEQQQQDAHGEDGYPMQQRPGAQYDEDGYPVNHRYGAAVQQPQYDEDGYPVTHRYNNGQSSGGISHYDEDGYPVRQGYGTGAQGSQYGQPSRTFSQRAQEEAAQGPYKTELPPPKEKKSGLSRLFQSDLLYLIIVNLPSEEEMAQFAPGGTNLQGERVEGY